MGAAFVIFTIMSLPYKYVETDEEKKAREVTKLEKENSGKNTLSTAGAEKKADSSSSSSSDDEKK